MKNITENKDSLIKEYEKTRQKQSELDTKLGKLCEVVIKEAMADKRYEDAKMLTHKFFKGTSGSCVSHVLIIADIIRKQKQI